MTGKPEQHPYEYQEFPDNTVLWIKAGLTNAVIVDLLPVPPLHGACETVCLQIIQA